MIDFKKYKKLDPLDKQDKTHDELIRHLLPIKKNVDEKGKTKNEMCVDKH